MAEGISLVALDAIRAEPGDVLIAYIGMPEMDGLELIVAVATLAPRRLAAS